MMYQTRDDTRRQALRSKKSRAFVDHCLRLPVLFSAEDILLNQEDLGLSDAEADILALELELNQLSKQTAVEEEASEVSYDLVPSVNVFDKVHREFICPLKTSDDTLIFYDCNMEDFLFLESFDGKGIHENSDRKSLVTSISTHGSLKHIMSSGAVGLNRRQISIKELVPMPLLNEFTVIMDAFERVTQGMSSNSLLSVKQAERFLKHVVKFQYNEEWCPRIFEYWRKRRVVVGRSLVREFQVPGSNADDSTFSAFKPRQKDRQLTMIRRQRRPNKDQHRKLFRMGVDFADLVSMVNFMIKRDVCMDSERIVKQLQFLERKKEVLDPQYSSPYNHASLLTSARVLLMYNLGREPLANCKVPVLLNHFANTDAETKSEEVRKVIRDQDVMDDLIYT